MESRLNAFRFAISPLEGTAPSPAAMDGGNMTHSYDDNDKINSRPVTTATNSGRIM